MSKIKLSIFTVLLKTVTGEQQKALLVVDIPNGYKSLEHCIVSRNKKEVVVHATSNEKIMEEIKEILFPKGLNYDLSKKQNFTRSEVVITSKIDEALQVEKDFESYSLEDSDCLSSANTLKNYINSKFTIDSNFTNIEAVASKRKIAFPKAKINWEETWNSPYLTDEEKVSMFFEPDLDIAMSNEGRDCRKILEKVINTNYFNKNFTAIGLHGNPGGGKTKMVLNDLCALNHIPVVAIPCDPMISVNQLLAQVGPVNQRATIPTKDLVPLINKLKNKLTILQQNDNPTKEEGEEINSILKTLENISNISKEYAELIKTPSILMKCLKYNLPLVVFLDEANVASTQFQNSLAPIISDGLYKDGPEIGHNNNTIKWVLAWNPNTSNSKTFDGKFFDRINFIQVEDVSSEQRIGYRTRKTIHGMYGSVPDYTEVDTLIKEASLVHPNIDFSKISDRVHKINASKEALSWYTMKEINRLTGLKNNPPVGKFSEIYLGDVALDTPDEAIKAIKEVDTLATSINQQLYSLTKGKDTKNPDRNSYFYISDRNMDIFTDYIFSYQKVGKAVKRFIFDLIPGGNTVKGYNTSEKTTEDKTSEAIADLIYNHLESDITKLDNIFFTSISDTDKKTALSKLKDIAFEEKKWVKPANPQEETAVPQDENNTEAQTDNPLDELDSITG